jgi:hypothetical protein
MTTYTPANEETDAKLRDLYDRRPQVAQLPQLTAALA